MKLSIRDIIYLVFFWGLSIVFLIAGIIGIYTFVRDSAFIRQASVTTATITDKFNRPNPNSDTEPLFFMVYSFTLPNNQVFSTQDKISYFEYVNIYSVGAQIEVHYDPANPDHHFYDTQRIFKSRLNSLYILFAISAGCFVGGALIYAMARMKNASRRKPDPLEILFDQAQVAAENDDYKTARQLLQKLLTADQSIVKAWILYAQLVPPDKRKKYLARALKLDPKNTVARQMLQAIEPKSQVSKPVMTNPQSDGDYGAQLMRISVSWQWRIIMMVVTIFTFGAWTVLFSTDSFQEYWALVLRERSIFVETLYHDWGTFFQLSILLLIGITVLLSLLATVGVSITIYELGIQRKSLLATKRIHWAEVTKAEYVENDVVTGVFGIKLSSEYKYSVALTNGKDRISFGPEFQKHPESGKLVVALLSNRIVVRQVDQFTITGPLQKLLINVIEFTER